ncbi:membrane protein [Spirochaetia bacterium]|nr:membrane protein [Spirochaetia bacterium]
MDKVKKTVFSVLLLSLLTICPLAAQTGKGGENLTIKIAVMGPGTELYFWWGHIALMIDDSETGRSRFYDYGVFSFESAHFFTNFAFGRLLYSCYASNSNVSISGYININRGVRIYTLDLPPEKRAEVRDFVETNILPQNKDYYYHQFKDNCSTRIRDILDLATDGQFKEKYGEASGRFTSRQHVRRHTWFSPVVDWILNFWMGQDIDIPLTVWEEMFLPAEVASRISDFWYTDAEGVTRKLVSGSDVIYEAVGRPAVLEYPRRQWPRELAFSLCLSLILGLFFFLQAKNLRIGQILLGVSHSLFGLVFGAAGLVLFFMSFFTNHDYTYHNANLLFANPLLLAAVPFGIRYAISKNRNDRLFSEAVLRLLWLLVALGIFASMLIKLLPWFWQQNLTDQMLMLPIALVLALEPLGLRETLGRIFWRWL